MPDTVDQKRNSYEDDDVRQLITELDELDTERESIKAEARGRISGVAKRIKAKFSQAKELRIPTASLKALMKTRALERKLKTVAEEVPADEVEVFEDMAGQFSFLAPPPAGEPAKVVSLAERAPAAKAARAAKERARANEEREQQEGAAILDDLGKTKH